MEKRLGINFVVEKEKKKKKEDFSGGEDNSWKKKRSIFFFFLSCEEVKRRFSMCAFVYFYSALLLYVHIIPATFLLWILM